MKKILLLGGSTQQIVAIETAKRLGIYTILCDYLTDNPGQYVADQYYPISTTDRNAILAVARENNVDGILAYASDPAAPTAAFVAEKMNLPGNPYESVQILCNKDLFRKFLREHDFCTPESGGYTSIKEAVNDCKNGRYRFPVIVKPVDSSGSKGVIRVDNIDELEKKIHYSMEFSRSGKIIIEEYVKNYGHQIAGDGLSINGELLFHCFGNDHFNTNSVNPYVPISASFPCEMPEWVQDQVQQEIQRLISLLGMRDCTYNFDIRIDEDFNIYLMEVAPRSGGNFIPQVIRYATGLDLVECAVKAAVGEQVRIPKNCECKKFWSYYAVNSPRDGVLKEVNILPEVQEQHIMENHIFKQSGDKILAFTGANATLGCLLMKFDSMDQMLYMMDHSEDWIKIKFNDK